MTMMMISTVDLAIFLGFMVQNVLTGCSRTSYKFFPLTNANKYLHSDTSGTEMNINISVNNGSENF